MLFSTDEETMVIMAEQYKKAEQYKNVVSQYW